MGTIKALNKWANAHSYYLIDLVRIILGVYLIIKVVDFMSNPAQMNVVMEPFQNWPASWLILHYVIGAHFIGGIFIIVGLLTRWAVLIQIPILIGAILTNLLGEMNVSNLVSASIVLVLCLFFLFYGSGKHSTDNYLKMQK